MSENGIWNLDELYRSPSDMNIELDMLIGEQRARDFNQKWSQRTDYMENPTVLREAMDAYEALHRNGGTGDGPAYYATLARAIDSSNAELKALEASVKKREIAMGKLLNFFSLSVGKISAQMQQVMLASAELAPHRVWLERRFETAAHDLSDEVQAVLMDILPLATTSWADLTEENLGNAQARIMIGDEWKKVPFNELTSHLTTSDADLAKRANQAHIGIARRHATTAEHELNTLITAKTRVSKLCKYSRVDEPSFLRNDLPAETVDSLLATVESHYDTSHRVHELMARLQGRTSIHYYERAMSYGSLPAGYTFDQAVSLVHKVYGNLHPDFVTLFDTALASGHIDHVTRKGKRGGAACWNRLIDQPTYELINFTGQLKDVLTVLHESGHMANNLYMQSGGRCNGMTFGTTKALAEVASTFFEKYGLDAVLEDIDDDDTRLAVLLSSLTGDVAKIYRQTAATRFEQALYAEIESKGYLSKQQIGKLFMHHMGAYMGPAVKLDQGADVGWVHWWHFRSGFYNYSYIAASLIASALQDKVDADPSYISEFIRFLETGRSMRTADLLQSLDLNPTDGSIWKPGLDKLELQTDMAFDLAIKLGKI